MLFFLFLITEKDLIIPSYKFVQPPVVIFSSIEINCSFPSSVVLIKFDLISPILENVIIDTLCKSLHDLINVSVLCFTILNLVNPLCSQPLASANESIDPEISKQTTKSC